MQFSLSISPSQHRTAPRSRSYVIFISLSHSKERFKSKPTPNRSYNHSFNTHLNWLGHTYKTGYCIRLPLDRITMLLYNDVKFKNEPSI